MGKRAIGYNFFIVDNKMILHFDIEVYRKFYSTIDLPTFEVVQSNGATFHYFKDKKNVYVDSHMNYFTVLPQANPDDFRILDFDRGMSNSGANDYLFDRKLPYPWTTYEPLSELYQKVDKQIFFDYTHELASVDADTFEVLYPDEVKNVARDKDHLYFRNQPVLDVDADSFHFLSECFEDHYYREQDHTYYAKDKNQAYYIDTTRKDFKPIKTKNLDLFCFKVIGELGYAFDGNYEYIFGKRKKKV